DKDDRDICVPRETLALLSDERLILRETGRAVTPFGGRMGTKARASVSTMRRGRCGTRFGLRMQANC
ncbi:MAG: hypothetical protein M3Y24_01540, partial [Acidobacteriota bacterium]|nr:hypothetical protein [Acidobacteriota bacterium]